MSKHQSQGPNQSKAPRARKAEGMSKPKEFKKFEDLLTRVLAVPKEELDRRDAEWKKVQKSSRRLRKKGTPKITPPS
jgi:hypothetical protein